MNKRIFSSQKKEPAFMKEDKVKKRARPRMPIVAKIGTTIIVINIFMALFGPFVAPRSPSEILTPTAFAKPEEIGYLGADYLGRDLLSRMLYGARMTIGLTLITTVIGFFLGITLGFTAAVSKSWVDNLISRFVDILLSFPPILLALIVIVGLGTSIPVLVGTVAVIQASRFARISRAIARNVAVLEFVETARARGENMFSILLREITPNSLMSLTVEFGLRLTFSILFLSALSFLGLGIQPPAADWGVMVRENISGLYYGSWSAILPATAISLLTVGINLVVDWMAAQIGKEISSELLQ